MKPFPAVIVATLLASNAEALIGYGIRMYDPLCAHACGRTIEAAPLSCSTEGHDHGHHMGGGSIMTTPECRSGDSSFLTTLAWCMNERCTPFYVEAWRLERYWSSKATGDPTVLPKWTFAQAVEAASPPVIDFNAEETINGTERLPIDDWDAQRRTLEEFEHQETLHSTYGLVALVTGFGTPVVLTALGYLPFMSGMFQKLSPYFVYPSLVGTYHVRPLPHLLGNAPTIGQAIYIGAFFTLNLVLAAVGYRSVGSLWFGSSYQEVLAYVANRTGVLAFALAPLVILFSGRNNILLWCTNWSHSTYMLLHRWVARIFTLQIVVHSITELVLYQDMGELATEQVQPYWIWGIVGTLAACIMVVASLLYMRRWSYEVFVILHIILAVFVIVGSWCHVEILFERAWGYEMWLYAACGVWFFDRLFRVLRIAKVGIRRSKVTEVGSAFVRVDIEGVRWSAEPGYHAYAYFPAVKPLAPWENHPFSVLPTAILQAKRHFAAANSDFISGSASSEDGDIEKAGGTLAVTKVPSRCPTSSTGVSLYIRKSQGTTGCLRAQERMVTLLDGPYRSNPTKEVLKCERLLLIAGGIGISGALPFANSHLNSKLFWSVKNYAECLVQDLEPVLSSLNEKEIRIGRRFDLQAVIDQEAEAASETPSKVKIGVVVCGPGSMCDDVRAMVARAGRHQSSKMVFELEVHAFSW